MEAKLTKHIERFINLDSSSIRLLSNVLEKKTIKKNELLLRDGQICNHYFFVLKGGLRQFEIDENGKEIIIHFGFENWWITDMESFYLETCSNYRIEALEQTEIIQIKREDFNMLLTSSLGLQFYFHKILQESSVIWQKKILYLQKPAEQRYIIFNSIYRSIEQRISQQHIASYLGISRETLSRIKSQLTKTI